MFFALLCVVAQEALAQNLRIEWPNSICQSIDCLYDGRQVVNRFNNYGGINVTCYSNKVGCGFYYGMIDLGSHDTKLTFSTDIYKISRIEISTPDNLGSKSFSEGWTFEGSKSQLIWSGKPASSVDLRTEESAYFGVDQIVFTLEELVYDNTWQHQHRGWQHCGYGR